MKLLPLLAGAISAELYPAGKSRGDSVVSMDSTHIVKVPLNENAELFGMSRDILWVSNNGAVSIDTLDTNDDEDISNNLVFAPLWGTSSAGDKPSNGKVFYRVISDSSDEAWNEIGIDLDLVSSDFLLTSALMVTFKNVINPMASDEKNNYQMIVAKGSANGTIQNHVIFNYHQMTWMPDDVTFGVFAALKETQQCGRSLNMPSTAEELKEGSNFTPPQKGKWVISFGSDLECDSERFRTECPEPSGKICSNVLNKVFNVLI